MYEVKTITAEEAVSIIETKDNVIILDVRREEEYKSGHLKNAILIPNEIIEMNPLDKLPDKDAIILVYCRAGVRSKEAVMKLLKRGYTHVYDIGGIIDWKYEIVKD